MVMSIFIQLKNTTHVICFKLLLSFLFSGLLPEEEHIILDEAGSPYKSNGTLIIDGYLEIKPNVTIQMSGGSSLIVRKGRLQAQGTLDMPITFDKLSPSEAWGGLEIRKKIRVAPEFQLLLAYNGEESYSVGHDEFNNLVESSQSKTLVRYCPDCQTSYKFIYYKRISSSDTFDLYDSLTCNFTNATVNNELNVDFGELTLRFIINRCTKKAISLSYISNFQSSMDRLMVQRVTLMLEQINGPTVNIWLDLDFLVCADLAIEVGNLLKARNMFPLALHPPIHTGRRYTGSSTTKLCLAKSMNHIGIQLS